MGWWQRFTAGVFSKDKSLATGVILGFMAWALMRLVDGVTDYNTLEYDVTHKSATLADGRAGFIYQVTFTNLAGDTTLKSMRASVSSNTAGIKFSVDPKDSRCVVQPPAWGRVVECEPFASGFNFTAPPLVAGTFAGIEVKYTRAAGNNEVPVLRILPAEGQDFRLVEAGLATFAVRNQTGILVAFALIAFISLFLSISAGVGAPRQGD